MTCLMDRWSQIQKIDMKIKFFGANLRFEVAVQRKGEIQIRFVITENFVIGIPPQPALDGLQYYCWATGLTQQGCNCTAKAVPDGKAIFFQNCQRDAKNS